MLRKKNIGIKSTFFLIPFLLLALAAAGGCNIKNMAMNMVGDALTAEGGSTVFTGDNDPELVGDALPFAIKMYESLMVSIPKHRKLRLQTGSLYVMYANAFLDTPAAMLTEEQYREQEFLYQRAKNLYLRGRDMLLEGLEKEHPGFKAALNKKDYDRALGGMKKEDVDFLYWAGAGWMGAYAIDPFDMELGVSMPNAAALMEKVSELSPGYGNGSIHDFYILYYGSLPDYMGGDPQKAREHYKKSLECKETATSPHLGLATSVCVKEQNCAEFVGLLKKVLAVDPDADMENRLLHTLNQRKARWLLEHLDGIFLEVEDCKKALEETKE